MKQRLLKFCLKYFKYLLLISFVFTTNSTHSQSLPGAPELTEPFNQVSSIGFDFDGNPISKGKRYFNSMGKPLQSQSWDVLTNKVWASVSLYDRHGRPVLQTLSAPIGTNMLYNYGFIRNSNNVSYGLADFDIGGSVSNPSPVSPTSPLGSYYSNSNSLNEYQDITQYPFVRRVYSKLNPGAGHKVLGGNKIAGEWKQSYTFSMPAGEELGECFGTNYGPTARVTKTVSRDVHGEDVVVYTDSEGNVLAAARSGDYFGHNICDTEVYIGAQGFVDIHIPKGVTSFGVTNPIPSITGSLKAYDLINETQVSVINGSTTLTVSDGFYRISVSNTDNYQEHVKNGGALVKVAHRVNYYHYSKNEFDKTGRLLESGQPLAPGSMKSFFTYNSLGQLLEATSPDEGTAKFLYRKDGQIRFSQNSKQALTGAFSYTHYDSFGRPIESGVYKGSITFAQAAAMVDYPNPLAEANCSEIHRTTYDLPDFDQFLDDINECGLPGHNYRQTFVAGNVAKTTTKNPHTSTTWYSYDALGRVTWMVQEIEGMSCFKTIDYTYSPQTGQVVKVDYQRHNADERFIHKYDYNPAGQLVAVHTSRDNLNYIEQAAYSYAESGELIRTVLAENLQGIDYVYNLNGQLKAINHPSLDPAKDPGQDGTSGSSIAADVFGFAIDYYNGDYSRTNTPTPVPQQNTNGNDQFNGNIKGVRFNTQGQPASGGHFNTYMYGYNTNNWLASATYGAGSEQSQGGGQYSISFTPNSNGDYGVSIPNYDANGNIKNLTRKGYTDANGTNAMDAFTYHYQGNKLQYVQDSGDNPDPTRYNDLKDQSNNGAANYLYNEIGQLVTDVSGKAIYEYNTSGLVTRIRTFGEGGSNQQPKQIYHQDFQTATSSELNLWTLSSGSKAINYAGTYSADGTTNHCAYLGSTYERSLRLSMPHNATASREYPVIAGIAHSLSLDVIVDQWREGAPSGQQQTPVGYIIEVFDWSAFSGSLNPGPLATVSYNTALNYINDPDMSGTACSKFYDQSHTLNFTPTGNKVVFRIKKLTTAGSEPIYLDNVYMEAATIPVVDIAYNDRGHRVKKTAYNLSNGNKNHTYYVRDASGTVLSIYTSTDTSKKGVPKQSELPVYGASRLGVLKMGTGASDPPTPDAYLYELTDHLGNVRAVIGKTSNGTPFVVARTDYYPFGMAMPNRNVEGNYRYKYQGQEKDPETGMEAFELRLWDSRIGRWLTVDPAGQYHSPYLGMGNNPISGIDPDGGKWKPLYISFFGIKLDITSLKVAALNRAIDNKISELGSMNVTNLNEKQRKDIVDRQNALNSMKRFIKEMGDSEEIEFSLDTQAFGDLIEVRATGLSSVSIPFNMENIENTARTIHEVYHGYKFIGPRKRFSIRSDLKYTTLEGYEFLNEVEAYWMQYAFDPNSIPVHQRIDVISPTGIEFPFFFERKIESMFDITEHLVKMLYNFGEGFIYSPEIPREKILSPRFF